MDSLLAVNSAADVLLYATLMWAALCSAVLYVDRTATSEQVLPAVTPRPRESLEEEPQRLAA